MRRSRYTHPSLTLASRVSEVQVLKRHGVGEREGELGADFSSAKTWMKVPYLFIYPHLEIPAS
jgi:hypothetical protein